MRRAAYAIAASLVLSATGCGGEDSEEAKVASAYNSVIEAIEQEDFEGACEGLSKATREDLRKAEMVQQTEGCGATLKQVVDDVGVDKQAMAEVAESDVEITDESTAMVNDVRLSKAGDEWLVEGEVDFVRPFLSGETAAQ